MTNVYVDIVGDLFHYGHVRFLEQAKRMGDRLVVGVCGDDLASTYKRPPIMTLAERCEVVSACRHVDLVVPDCPCPVTEAFLREHAIDLVVHGDDFDEATVEFWYGVPRRLGMFRTVGYTPSISTSDVIDRIASRFGRLAG